MTPECHYAVQCNFVMSTVPITHSPNILPAILTGVLCAACRVLCTIPGLHIFAKVVLMWCIVAACLFLQAYMEWWTWCGGLPGGGPKPVLKYMPCLAKNSHSGKRHWLGAMLVWPVTFLFTNAARAWKWFKGKQPWVHVGNGFYVGCVWASPVATWNHHQRTMFVDCCLEIDRHPFWAHINNMETFNAQCVDDTLPAPFTLAKFIRDFDAAYQHNPNAQVYVGCAFGQGRSATTCALLMAKCLPHIYPTWRHAFETIVEHQSGAQCTFDQAYLADAMTAQS